jgi:predicted O-linked N-acetylglucosamine transferase (SPINDLY family)
LGEALRRLGRLQEAADVLVRTVALRPELPEASFNLATVLMDLGETESALTCLVRAADVAPERYEIQYRLAQALTQAGELARAVPHYQTALTDATMDPEGAAHARYTERSLRLPDAFWCYDPLTEGPTVSEPPALTNGYFTFGSFNAFWKTNPYVFALWSKVLEAVPGSHFVLLAPNAEAERCALEAFAKEGIDAARIQFVPRRSRLDYLAGHAALDVALDTLPYSGHTTTLDALWMGVPVVTLVGQTAAGRAGLSVMRCVGLPDLATESEAEFVDRARRLSEDLPALAQLRAGLRQQLLTSVAMDSARFAVNFEAALREAWHAWCASRS